MLWISLLFFMLPPGCHTTPLKGTSVLTILRPLSMISAHVILNSELDVRWYTRLSWSLHETHTFYYFNSPDFQQNLTKGLPFLVKILETVFFILWHLRFSRQWEFWFSSLWHCQPDISISRVEVTMKKDAAGSSETLASKNSARYHNSINKY